MKSRINFKTIFTLLVIVFAFNSYKAHAQEGFASVTDSLANELEQVKSDVTKLKKLKISGYIQAQYQSGDSIPGKFIGGDFKDANGGIQANRFKLRRGRIKFAYETELSQFVLQFDVTENGFATKDAYGKFTEPFLKAFSVTTGIFNRPFGYEIEYSSSNRETPERSRFTQTLFPGERDLGAMLTYQPAKGSAYDFIRVQAGWFSGNGINADTHTGRDFIGRAGFAKDAKEGNIKFGGGFSYYSGGTFMSSTVKYTSNGSTGFTKSDNINNMNSYAKREYYGLDGQFSAATPFGLSSLRAEYAWGTQSSADLDYGTSATAALTKTVTTANTTTGAVTTATVGLPVYERKFSGMYLYYIQNILNSKHNFVLKYDVFDPNTDVAGTDIKTSNGFNKADIKYSTLGLGYVFNFDANVKISAYYEMPKNEKTAIKGFVDVQKANSITLRVQYKF